MSDTSSNPPVAPAGLRLLLAATGFLFVGGAAVLLYVVFRLLFSGPVPFDVTTHDKLFWVLCGIVALCLLMLGINFLSGAMHRRSHNIVPGPTLYLLGVTLVILGMFLAVSGAMIAAAVLVLAGVGCMHLEYRSEFI